MKRADSARLPPRSTVATAGETSNSGAAGSTVTTVLVLSPSFENTLTTAVPGLLAYIVPSSWICSTPGALLSQRKIESVVSAGK